MRKNALAMSIATLIGGLGFVGAASADVIVGTGPVGGSATQLGLSSATQLVVNNGGIGHALLTPYFSAQNGNATLISIVNTDTTNGKAVKVRFRGASNSDDILDFTVLMSPGDVWNATVTAASGGVANIVTQDRSCTVPQLQPGVPQSFVTTRLTSKGGNDIANNTREGYIEIFNMADIPPATGTSSLFATVKHNSSGVPTCSSTVINAAILTTNWVTEAGAAGAGLNTPTTGLFGNWAIINVPQTTTYSGEMIALRAQDVNGVDARGNFVLFPQSASAYTGAIENVTGDPLFRTTPGTVKDNNGAMTTTAGPAIPAAFFDLPDMSTPYTAPGGTITSPAQQTQDLSTALAVKSVMNEYVNDAIISAKTDWVFSMPTRRYQVAMDYAPSTSRRLFSTSGVAPTPQYFYTDNTSVSTTNSQQICVGAQSQTFYDREEGTKTSGAVFSPGNLTVTNFCGEVSVLSFNDAGNSALSASVARQDTGTSAFTNGWGNIAVLNPVTSLGLPVVGSAFVKATTGRPSAGAGFAGTYGLSFEHRFTR